MFSFHILVTPYGIYARTPSEHERAKRRPFHELERWQEVQAGSRGQAMGIGWQLRNAGAAKKAPL